MTNTKRSCLILLTLASILSAAYAQNSAPLPSTQGRPGQAALPQPPLWVALLLSDGVLAPFAAYQSGRWTDPWPQPNQDYDADIRLLEDIPARWLGGAALSRTWFLRQLDGRASTLRLRQPVAYQAHCQSAWGLLHDHPLPPPPQDLHAEPVGVALSMDRPFQPVEPLAQDAPERMRFASFLNTAFRELEAQEIAAAIRNGDPVESGKLRYYDHPADAAARQSIPLVLDTLYRTAPGSAADRLYYVEAGKQYPNALSGPDGRCWGLSLLQGWLREDDRGNLSWVKRELTLSDCFGKEVAMSTPLAVLSLDGRTSFAVYTHYYEGEAYSILEFDGNELREIIETPGGGC